MCGLCSNPSLKKLTVKRYFLPNRDENNAGEMGNSTDTWASPPLDVYSGTTHSATHQLKGQGPSAETDHRSSQITFRKIHGC